MGIQLWEVVEVLQLSVELKHLEKKLLSMLAFSALVVAISEVLLSVRVGMVISFLLSIAKCPEGHFALV